MRTARPVAGYDKPYEDDDAADARPSGADSMTASCNSVQPVDGSLQIH